jgi:hypothetical protein
MAWRVDEHVIRGEIENRTRGRVSGKIWFVGRHEPVELELAGNCWRDLAGRRLEFVNPEPKPGIAESFVARQMGTAGDITASRKVKVLDFPLEDMHLYYKTGREMPWHWGNSLYLEWFSERNGRVLIETASFELKIVGEPVWEMTEAEEEQQRRANGEAMAGFVDELSAAAAQHGEPENGEHDPSPLEKPEAMTEEQAEQMQARSDLLNDRIQARLAREGAEADYEKILTEEIERLNREYPAPEPTPEQRAQNEAWLERFNRASEEALENPDPEFENETGYEHPLAERAMELSAVWRDRAEAENWLPDDAIPEHPVQELLNAIRRAGVKLAAALNGRSWPPELDFCALTIVQLKKVREYLDDALRAMESCQEEKLLTSAQLGPALVDVVDLAEDVDELLAELRAKLERGTE